MRRAVVPMIPDPMLPGGCSDNDDYFDVPSITRITRHCSICGSDSRKGRRECAHCNHPFCYECYDQHQADRKLHKEAS